MRHQTPSHDDDRTEVITSAPVPVPSPADLAARRDRTPYDRTPGDRDALDDRGSSGTDTAPGRGDRFDDDRTALITGGRDHTSGDRSGDDDRTAVITGGHDRAGAGSFDDDRTALITSGRDRTPADTDGDGLSDRDRGDLTDRDGLGDPVDSDGDGIADRDGATAHPHDHDGSTDRHDDPEAAEFHEPAPQPTAFGAATVGGAVAASAMADDHRATEHDVRDSDADRSRDGVTVDEVADAEGRTGTLADDADPHAVTPVPGTEGSGRTDLMPGEVPEEPLATLISADSAQYFRDRWRDVQLRFVDDPKAAVTDARGLVDEVVEALAAALAAQKDQLTGTDTDDDTERLRVALRRHRDFLDRLLGL